jgi:hypothetical protein
MCWKRPVELSLIRGYSNSGNIFNVTQQSFDGSDYWLVKIDPNGTKLWDQRFRGSDDEFFGSLAFRADSTILAFGHSDSGSSPVKSSPSQRWFDYWIVKFRYADTVTVIPPQETLTDFTVYPNPANDQGTLRVFSPTETSASVLISDFTGRTLHTWQVLL